MSRCQCRQASARQGIRRQMKQAHTVPPGIVQSNDFVNKRWICISSSLRFSDKLWVASFACTVHLVQC